MPQAAVVAAIPAFTAAFGSTLQYRAGRQAANDQKNATNRAIEMERQREAERLRRQEANADRRRAAFLNYYLRYGDEAIDRYGFPAGIDPGILPARSGGQTSGRTTPAPSPNQTGATPTGVTPTARPQGFLGGLMDSQQPNTGASVLPGMNSQPFNWNEWERYL